MTLVDESVGNESSFKKKKKISFVMLVKFLSFAMISAFPSHTLSHTYTHTPVININTHQLPGSPSFDKKIRGWVAESDTCRLKRAVRGQTKPFFFFGFNLDNKSI